MLVSEEMGRGCWSVEEEAVDDGVWWMDVIVMGRGINE
jgi:hypothetical protein